MNAGAGFSEPNETLVAAAEPSADLSPADGPKTLPSRLDAPVAPHRGDPESGVVLLALVGIDGEFLAGKACFLQEKHDFGRI